MATNDTYNMQPGREWQQMILTTCSQEENGDKRYLQHAARKRMATNDTYNMQPGREWQQMILTTCSQEENGDK